MGNLREALGTAAGWLVAPVTGMVALVRHARMFHPDGVVRRVRVVPIPESEAARRVGERLEGPAIVRFSSAWWRGDKEWIDALGCAIRFVADEEFGPDPKPGDQDLLFATIRFPWTTPLAPLATNVHSFLDDNYFAVSPFDVEDAGVVKFRLATPKIAGGRGERKTSLDEAVRSGEAVLRLDMKRPGILRGWTPVAKLVVQEELAIDQAALRFSPFRSGRGIRPRGFVHALRRGTYALSQAARPAQEPEKQLQIPVEALRARPA